MYENPLSVSAVTDLGLYTDDFLKTVSSVNQKACLLSGIKFNTARKRLCFGQPWFDS